MTRTEMNDLAYDIVHDGFEILETLRGDQSDDNIRIIKELCAESSRCP